MQHRDSAALQLGVLQGTNNAQVVMVEECQCYGLVRKVER